MRRSVPFSGWELPTDTITGLSVSGHDMSEVARCRDVKLGRKASSIAC